MISLDKYHATLCLIPFIFSHPTYTPTENSVRFTLKNIQSLAMFHHLHSYDCDPSHHQLSPGLLQSLLPSLCASAFVYWTWPEQSQSDGRPRPSSAQNLPWFPTSLRVIGKAHDLWGPTWLSLLRLFLNSTNIGLCHPSLNTPGKIALCTGCSSA